MNGNWKSRVAQPELSDALPPGVIDGRSRFTGREIARKNVPAAPTIRIPEEVVAPYRAQWAKRKPTGINPATASLHEVAARACALPYLLRTSIAAAGRGRRRALKWAAAWLQAGCPGVALPPPRKGWRAANMHGIGIALYDSDADRAFLWLAPPPWFQQSAPLEEVWYALARNTLTGHQA